MKDMSPEEQTAFYNKIISMFSYSYNGDNVTASCYLKLGNNIYEIVMPAESTLSYGFVPRLKSDGRPRWIQSISKVVIEGRENLETKPYFEWKNVTKWFYHKNRNILAVNGNHKNISNNLSDLVEDLDTTKVSFQPILKKRNDITTSFL
jgi:hypothetical protein